jgi:hypothetical protein
MEPQTQTPADAETQAPGQVAHGSKRLPSTRLARLTSAESDDAGRRENGPIATWSTASATPAPLAPPPSPAEDARILADIKRSIAAQSALSSDAPNVSVTVSRGVVTMNGTVKDEQTRAAFEAIVRNTRGVTKIESVLRAKNPSPIDLTPGPTGY